MSEIDRKLKANRRLFVLVISIVTLLLYGPPVYGIIGQFLPNRSTSYGPHVEISFSQLVTDVDTGHVRDIIIKRTEIDGTYNDGHHFQADMPDDPALLQRLYNKGVLITKQP
jgi:cell division protease FtsH